jgi:hypothetical protein
MSGWVVTQILDQVPAPVCAVRHFVSVGANRRSVGSHPLSLGVMPNVRGYHPGALIESDAFSWAAVCRRIDMMVRKC